MRQLYSIVISILLFGSISSISARPEWKIRILPGGNVVETIIVNDTLNTSTVQGIIAVNKNGGLGWLPWTGTTWGNFQLYDAYHPWFMGGDVKVIGDSLSEELFAIVGTMEGRHIYSYDTLASSWGNGLDLQPNGYHQYADMAFYVTKGGHETSSNYLTSSNSSLTRIMARKR